MIIPDAAALKTVPITDWAREQIALLREGVLNGQSEGYRQMRRAIETMPFPAIRDDGGQRTATVPVAVPPPAPLGAISARLVGEIPYPPLRPAVDPRQYGATLRYIGAATGTRTLYEADAAWRLALEAAP